MSEQPKKIGQEEPNQQQDLVNLFQRQSQNSEQFEFQQSLFTGNPNRSSNSQFQNNNTMDSIQFPQFSFQSEKNLNVQEQKYQDNLRHVGTQNVDGNLRVKEFIGNTKASNSSFKNNLEFFKNMENLNSSYNNNSGQFRKFGDFSQINSQNSSVVNFTSTSAINSPSTNQNETKKNLVNDLPQFQNPFQIQNYPPKNQNSNLQNYSNQTYFQFQRYSNDTEILNDSHKVEQLEGNNQIQILEQEYQKQVKQFDEWKKQNETLIRQQNSEIFQQYLVHKNRINQLASQLGIDELSELIAEQLPISDELVWDALFPKGDEKGEQGQKQGGQGGLNGTSQPPYPQQQISSQTSDQPNTVQNQTQISENIGGVIPLNSSQNSSQSNLQGTPIQYENEENESLSYDLENSESENEQEDAVQDRRRHINMFDDYDEDDDYEEDEEELEFLRERARELGIPEDLFLSDRDFQSTDYEALLMLEKSNVNIGASKQQIQKIPIIQITEQNNFLKGEKCMICLEGYEMGEWTKKLPCKHVYHAECIDTWFAQKCVCPVCGMDFKEFLDNQKI